MKLKLENDGKKEKSSSTHSVDRSVIRKRMLFYSLYRYLIRNNILMFK